MSEEEVELFITREMVPPEIELQIVLDTAAGIIMRIARAVINAEMEEPDPKDAEDKIPDIFLIGPEKPSATNCG